ncbi:hypothetical protein B0T20DRAFT_344470, partial [Sordaria brevicollis]
PVDIPIRCSNHHEERLEQISEIFAKAWTAMIDLRKIHFQGQEMQDLQDAEIDEERTAVIRVVFNPLLVQGRIRESLQKGTPFYHPLLGTMFRQVAESRKRLILCGLINQEDDGPSSQSMSGPPALPPREKMPGPPALPSLRPGTPCSDPAKNPSTVLEEDAVEDDVEEPVADMELDENLPCNEELGIRPSGTTRELPSVDPSPSPNMDTSKEALQDDDK